ACTPVGRAEEPFTISATSMSGTPQSASASGSSVVDLLRNAVNTRGQFRGLSGQDISGAIRYGRIGNAVLFTRNAAGTSATVTVPSIRFTKTFTGNTSSDVEKQIEN